MKKLLVAIAVVASIGVTLSEKQNVKVMPNYKFHISQGWSEGAAMDEAVCQYVGGASLGEVLAD